MKGTGNQQYTITAAPAASPPGIDENSWVEIVRVIVAGGATGGTVQINSREDDRTPSGTNAVDLTFTVAANDLQSIEIGLSSKAGVEANFTSDARGELVYRQLGRANLS